MNALEHHDWPGNIRELQNVIERGVIMTTGPVLSTQTTKDLIRWEATAVRLPESAEPMTSRRWLTQSVRTSPRHFGKPSGWWADRAERPHNLVCQGRHYSQKCSGSGFLASCQRSASAAGETIRMPEMCATVRPSAEESSGLRIVRAATT